MLYVWFISTLIKALNWIELNWIDISPVSFVKTLWWKCHVMSHLGFLIGTSVRVMVFNATFNNISVILWRSVLFVEETRVPGENHWPAASHWQLYHIMLYQVHLAYVEFELMLVVVSTDYIGSYKSNYHMIMTKMAPWLAQN